MSAVLWCRSTSPALGEGPSSFRTPPDSTAMAAMMMTEAAGHTSNTACECALQDSAIHGPSISSCEPMLITILAHHCHLPMLS